MRIDPVTGVAEMVIFFTYDPYEPERVCPTTRWSGGKRIRWHSLCNIGLAKTPHRVPFQPQRRLVPVRSLDNETSRGR